MLRNFIRFAQKTLRVLSERQPIGKSESRDHLCSGDDAFSQLYFVYCKKKRQNQGANYPGCADGDLLVVHLRSGVRNALTNAKHGAPEWVLRVLARLKGFEPLRSSPFRGLLRNFIRFAQKTLRVLRSGVRNALTNAKHGAPEWVLRVLARLKGFEPLTFWSVARRSIQLS